MGKNIFREILCCQDIGFSQNCQTLHKVFELSDISRPMIMDIVDGRLARLTNTMSEFGSQYDSLADMVSFGVAPALVLHAFVLNELGRVGSLITFLYIACAALRLARFNVASSDDKKFFTGLPSPGSAGLLASALWVCVDYGIAASDVIWLFALLVAMCAISMVSNIPYRSFKDIDIKEQMPFVGLIALVIVMALIYLDPPAAFLLIGSMYMVSGILLYAYGKWKVYRGSE